MRKNLVIMIALVASTLSFNAFAGGSIEAGKAIVEKSDCFSCHGANFNTPTDASYPKLAGQHQDYLEHALVAYQRGADGSAYGRIDPNMNPRAKKLSRQDIKDVAAYLHSLPGSLDVRK